MTPSNFLETLSRRILVLDGAMGTMIQRLGLTEQDYRGDRFRDFDRELKGNNDLLVLTHPEDIAAIHRAYIQSGADIISTNSFNANAISLSDYGMQSYVAEINREAARLARREADAEMERTGRKVWVAGSCGPTNRAASMSPDVADPARRDISFDQLSDAYAEQVSGLIEGGADLILFETVFDTLNLKAALDGAERAFDNTNVYLPIMVSVTVSDRGGHTLSGQTLDAFITSVGDRDDVVSIGLNCSFGPKDIIPHLNHLAAISPYPVSCHPNAGLPDELGAYKETPQTFVETLRPVIEEGRLNIVGGCCGTTPKHIAALARLVHSAEALVRPFGDRANHQECLRLSGLDIFDTACVDFTVVGERCNVAGSRKFLRLIKEENYEEAIKIAARQIEDGAMVIDINMDDALLDAPVAMRTFLNIIAGEPEIARVPVMIDSSNWDVVETALRTIQGRPIVNSISLKEGEVEFLHKARRIRKLGAAVVVMAFDEEGQAATYERKIQICARAYKLLTQEVGFKGCDIIFDPNVMAIATGIEEHDLYALDFIRATEWIKKNLPGAKVSGGVSNLSFSFRGNNPLREAMHCVFLHHARLVGMDMAIVNPATLQRYEDIEPTLRNLLDDVILARRAEAPVELAELAMRMAADKDAAKGKSTAGPATKAKDKWRELPVTERLTHAVINGVSDHLDEDITQALQAGWSPSKIIGEPLMQGMEEVGRRFGAGEMFLPQVVKTARTMKDAVSILRPVMEKEKENRTSQTSAGRILFATVKGDVHDIGKNIVSIVLECNNFEVVDLGVMVPAEKIVEEARRLHPDVIALSGLITPSLGEMVHVASELEKAGLNIPLMVGGAATSALHTALKIAPAYSAPVIHARDAAQNPVIAAKLLNPELHDEFVNTLRREEAELAGRKSPSADLLTLAESRDRRLSIADDYEPVRPAELGKVLEVKIRLKDILTLINWKYYLLAWRVFEKGKAPRETEQLLADAKAILDTIPAETVVSKALIRFDVANSSGDDIVIINGNDRVILPMLRNQKTENDGPCLSLADFLIPAERGVQDYIGLFCVTVTARLESDSTDDYRRLLSQTLRDRLAEASSEWLHREVRRRVWGYASDETLSDEAVMREEFAGIRPAVGYPSLPDQLMTHEVARLLPVEKIGVELTENGAMSPSSTVCGLYLANPAASYFTIHLDETQLTDYAQRRGLPPERLRTALLPLL